MTNSANKCTIDITNGGERMDINLQLDDQYFFKNKVLIIDDLEMNRVILSQIFESDYEIIEAQDGLDGLEKIKLYEDSLCAILLDFVMPKLDGMQLLEILYQKGIVDDIPVFLITAENSYEIMEKAYFMGVMDVIDKPIIPYVVERRVASVIELFQARRKLSHTVELQKYEIQKQTQKIVDLNMGMIESLATAIEFRDGESGEHVKRIHDITKYMLEHTEFGKGFTEEEIQAIATASIMHDVGKIAIPDYILNKPGKLTKEEYEIMKTHTVQGSELLLRIPQMHDHDTFKYAYDIARHHHERYDGRGYPDGLKGDEISIWAQIVSLADVYDALVSKRVYKKAYAFEEAKMMIAENKCGVFNPALLDSFFKVENNLRQFYTKKG